MKNPKFKCLFCFTLALALDGSAANGQGTNEKSQGQKSTDAEFQRNTEQSTVETWQESDGKITREVKTGKTRQRQGPARVGEIEEGEIDRVSRRQKSLSLKYFGFGPYGSSKVGDSSLLYGFSYGHRWEVSTTGEITADLLSAINGKGSLWYGGLGFSLLPMTTNISPLVGASVGFGYADGDKNHNTGGFAGQFSAGLRMFRLSETQMEIVGNYTAVFGSGAPGVYGVQIRVLY